MTHEDCAITKSEERAVRSLLVVGNGLAGLSAVRAARELGFAGPVQVLGAEPGRPYDRPPLSKDYLAGTSAAADLVLDAPREDLDAEWLTGSAVSLEPGCVVTADGQVLAADGIVLATGSRARTLPELPHTRENVLVLRTRDDADRLRAELVGGRHLVVVGAGLIGCEVAATATGLGCRVTLLTPERTPLERLVGARLAPRLLDLHRGRGVTVRTEASIAGADVTGDRVTALRLAGGEVIAADVVLVAVGAAPETEWLRTSGLDLGDGVRCDQAGRVLADGTAVPGLVAVGDCAAWWDPHLGRHHRAQHWTDALERPGRAVAALLGVPAPTRRPYLPYFWSDQHGHRVQMAGYASLADAVDVETDLGDQGFLAVYRRSGEPVAVLSLDRPREFVRWRKTLVASLGQLPEIHTEPALAAAPSVAAPAPA
ncbi:MAG TPA: FAD-dependent oxidoreductase [Friedmanniella sp.]